MSLVNRRFIRIATLFLAIISLALLSLTLYVNNGIKNELDQKVQLFISNEMKSIELKVESFFTNYISVVDTMKKDPNLLKYIREVDRVEKKKSHDKFEYVLNYLSDINDSHDEVRVSWVALNQINQFQNHDIDLEYSGEDYLYEERPWYRALEKNLGNTTVTPIYEAIRDNEPVVTIATPVFPQDHPEGKLKDSVGAICLDITLVSLIEYIESYEVGERGIVGLVDDDGYLICQDDNCEILSKSFSSVTLSNGGEKQSSNKLDRARIDGETYYYAYEEIELIGWKILVLIPTSAYKETYAWVDYYWFGTVFLVIVIIVAFFMLRMVRNQFRALTRRNEELASSKAELVSRYEEIEEVVSSLNEKEHFIKTLAYTDELTGLPNRRYFMESLKERLESEAKGHVAIMMLDLDNFKEINDTKGHVFGDRILREIGEFLNGIIDNRALLSRFGGDEFLIYQTGINNIGDVNSLADEIIGRFNDEFRKHENLSVTVSMGISLYPEHSREIHELISFADTAMYDIKERGKNAYTFFDSRMRIRIEDKLEINNLLDSALEKDGFHLLYQPYVDVNEKRVVGAEALIRLQDASISPDEFIKVAESNGQIIQMGRWVVHEAIQTLSHIRSEGHSGYYISVNLSPVQINDTSFIQFVREEMEEQEVDPSALHIEITEGLFLFDRHHANDFIDQLRDLGIKISLDDFGTGYSSISYLTYLSVDTLKLDKSLSDKFMNEEGSKTMKSLIDLGHSLNLEVIAEGIEEEEQVVMLTDLKCDLIQGYYFYKPMTRDNFMEVIESK